MYMRDKEPSPTEHRFRCVRRLVSRTAEFPLVGSDWVDERVILCPDNNSTHGGGADANGTGTPPVDY